MPPKPLKPIEFLARPSASPAELRQGMPLDAWPGVTRRALSGPEREWLDTLAGMPCPDGVVWVLYGDLRLPYERSFFRQRVEWALECGKGRVGVDAAGQLVAVLPNGEHTVLTDFPTTGAARENAAPGAVGCAPLPEREPAAAAQDLTDAAGTGQGARAASRRAADVGPPVGDRSPRMQPPRPSQGGTNTGGRGLSFFPGGKGGTYASHSARDDS